MTVEKARSSLRRRQKSAFPPSIVDLNWLPGMQKPHPDWGFRFEESYGEEAVVSVIDYRQLPQLSFAVLLPDGI